MTEDTDLKAARERQRKIAGDLACLVERMTAIEPGSEGRRPIAERIEHLEIQIRLEMDEAMMDGTGEIGSKARC